MSVSVSVCGVGGEDAGEDVCGRYMYDVDKVSVDYVLVCLFISKLLVLKLI